MIACVCSFLQLTRDEFERLNADLFESVVEPIRAALEDADLGPQDVDEIVLVGGSTRIPKVRQVVGSFFGCVLLSRFGAREIRTGSCELFDSSIHGTF